MAEFLKFNCGCCGIQLDNGSFVVINDCCDDEGNLGFNGVGDHHFDDLPDAFDSMSDDEILALSSQVHELIKDGYRFQAMRNLLKL